MFRSRTAAPDQGIVVLLLPLREIDVTLVVHRVNPLSSERYLFVSMAGGIEDKRLLRRDQRLRLEGCRIGSLRMRMACTV